MHPVSLVEWMQKNIFFLFQIKNQDCQMAKNNKKQLLYNHKTPKFSLESCLLSSFRKPSARKRQ